MRLSLALTQKLPKSATKQLQARRKGTIVFTMQSEGLLIEGRYTINSTDGRLEATSRWIKFRKAAKLTIGRMVKVDVSRCPECSMLFMNFLDV